MKTIIALTLVSLLQGCALLGALGIGPTDVLPSLRHCSKVDYERRGLDIDIKAKCQVPVG